MTNAIFMQNIVTHQVGHIILISQGEKITHSISKSLARCVAIIDIFYKN